MRAVLCAGLFSVFLLFGEQNATAVETDTLVPYESELYPEDLLTLCWSRFLPYA